MSIYSIHVQAYKRFHFHWIWSAMMTSLARWTHVILSHNSNSIHSEIEKLTFQPIHFNFHSGPKVFCSVLSYSKETFSCSPIFQFSILVRICKGRDIFQKYTWTWNLGIPNKVPVGFLVWYGSQTVPWFPSWSGSPTASCSLSYECCWQFKKTKLESKSKNFSPTPSKDKVYDTDFDMIMTGFWQRNGLRMTNINSGVIS